MKKVFRLLLGFALLPMCWAFTRVLGKAIIQSDGWFSANSLSLLAGVATFALCWLFLSHPVKTYVLGHELTHALWGLLFGAKAKNLKVGETGGSVKLTKTNFLISLAPYFFPFYTFVVILAALVTAIFVRPLPFLPGWIFLVGFTWSFHALFTLQTLTERQSDITLNGRIFSWVFIFLANVSILLVWLAATTELTFFRLACLLLDRITTVYSAIFHFILG